MTDIRRCLRKSKHGCSQEKPISEFDGKQRRCRECQTKFDNIAATRCRRNASQAKGAEFNIQAIGAWYFCKMPVVFMSEEIRMARRLG